MKRCHTASGRSFGKPRPSNSFAPASSVNWNDFVRSSESSRPFHRTSKQPGSATGGIDLLPLIDGKYSRTSRHEPLLPSASQVPEKTLVIDGHEGSAERVAALWPHGGVLRRPPRPELSLPRGEGVISRVVVDEHVCVSLHFATASS